MFENFSKFFLLKSFIYNFFFIARRVLTTHPVTLLHHISPEEVVVGRVAGEGKDVGLPDHVPFPRLHCQSLGVVGHVEEGRHTLCRRLINYLIN